MKRPLRGSVSVARRELRAYLLTPWPYAVAAAFLLLTGIVFYVVTDGTREASLRFWFPNLAFVLTVTVPVLTSRLVAEEWRTRHLDVLLSRAVSPAGLLVGKWLAATLFNVCLLGPTLVYVYFLSSWGTPDYPPILASYAGAVLLIAMFCAVGTLTSALTPTAVAAGLASLSLLVGAQLAGGLDALRGLSFQPHIDAFSRGAPALEDLVYFVSVTAACLIIGAAAQLARLRPAGRLQALAFPAAVLGAAIGLNWMPLPAQARVDVTSSGRFTLSQASKDVLANVKVPARITVFETNGTAEARDARVLLAQFRRENERVKTRVLDFSNSMGEALRVEAADDGDVVVEARGRREVLSPLTEEAVTSALQRLVRGAPQLACALAGHGERELDDTAPGGYDEARLAMRANGVPAKRLDLTVAEAVPKDCTMLILAGPTTAPLEKEVQLISAYLAAEGRMLILTDPGGRSLDALTTRWGLRGLPGVIVDRERGAAGDPTTVLVNRFPSKSPVVDKVNGLQVVGAGGITTAAAEAQGLGVAKLAESSDDSWLEQSTTEAAYEPEKGDRHGPVVLAASADASQLEEEGESRVPSGGARIVRTRLVLIADPDVFANALIGIADNRRLLGNTLNWLAGQEDLVAVGGEDPDLRRLLLTDSRRKLMGWTTIAGLPSAALLAGALCWQRRRRR